MNPPDAAAKNVADRMIRTLISLREATGGTAKVWREARSPRRILLSLIKAADLRPVSAFRHVTPAAAMILALIQKQPLAGL